MASAPPVDIIWPLKQLCILTLLADATLSGLVSRPDGGLVYTGVYSDTIPAPGQRGLPARASLYPAVVVHDQWSRLDYVHGVAGLSPIGWEALLNISAATDSASETELVAIVNRTYVALNALNGGVAGSGIVVRSMIAETPLSDQPQAATGASRRWLGALWRAKGDFL